LFFKTVILYLEPCSSG